MDFQTKLHVPKNAKSLTFDPNFPIRKKGLVTHGHLATRAPPPPPALMAKSPWVTLPFFLVGKMSDQKCVTLHFLEQIVFSALRN